MPFAQVQKLVFSDQHIRTWVHCFQYTTNLLIKEKSVNHVGSTLKYVDIVKDVINLLPIYWIAEEIVSRKFVQMLSLTMSLSGWPRVENEGQSSRHLQRPRSVRTIC
jgi:hypothetical protein